MENNLILSGVPWTVASRPRRSGVRVSSGFSRDDDFCWFMTAAEARRLAFAILDAADRAERKGSKQ